jgi:hypothetical protein
LIPSLFISFVHSGGFSQEPARRATSPVMMRIETNFMVISRQCRPAGVAGRSRHGQAAF